MKILFLDDMAARRRLVQQWFKGDNTFIHARNASECLGAYLLFQNSYEPFDLVSLDHDLGSRWNGQHVVNHILVMHDRLTLARPKFAVHSWNIPAAERMTVLLQRAGFEVLREPFSPPAYMRDGKAVGGG